MKILHTVEFYTPSVGGMQEVVKQLSERLAGMGHDVSVATSSLPGRSSNIINGVNIKEFSVTGNLARGLCGEFDSYREFVLKNDFDVITNFAAQQWATDSLLEVLLDIKCPKVFVPTGFSGLNDSVYSDYFKSMRRWLKLYDMNVFLSENYRDINFARSAGVENILVIPNGASEDEFVGECYIDIRSKLGVPQDHLLILHVGSHTSLKGHVEAIEIFRQATIKKATLLLVANDFGGGCTQNCLKSKRMFKVTPRRLFDGKRLLVLDLPRDLTVAAYKAADLFLFPSKIECSPLVLFESMASKTPFLTTDVGNAIEIIEWSQGGELLPTIIDDMGHSNADVPASVSVLEEFCRDSLKRATMADQTYKAWNSRFTWGKIAKDYEALYLSLRNH